MGNLRESDIFRLHNLPGMVTEEVYGLVLQKVMASHQRPRRVILKNKRPGQYHASGSKLLEVMCDLVNRRIELEEEDQKKLIPVFRHVTLKRISAEEMDLEVVLEERAAQLLTE